MWLERFLIIVPSLGHKYLPYTWGTYRPRPVEIMITIATFAAMMLLYVLFAKFVPIISIWELKVGRAPRRRRHTARGGRGTPLLRAASVKARVRALSRSATPRSAPSTACAPPVFRTADITVISGEPIEHHELGARDQATWMFWIASGGGVVGLAFGDVADAHDRDGVAAADRQHADRVVVAEPDRHVRVDDAGRDPRDGDHAARHRGAAARRSKLYDPEVTTARSSSASRTRPRNSPQSSGRSSRAVPTSSTFGTA